MWLDYGFEFGNHTFTHASLNQVGLKAWEDDVIQGESVTRMLLGQRKMKLRYFRHPYLDTGRDLLTRRQAEAFLVERGYRIAPITLDGWDWMFAGMYEDAKQRNDTALQQQIVKEYLAHHDAAIAYSEQTLRQGCRVRTEADSAATREQPGSRPHWRIARPSPQARISLHYPGRALSDQAYSLPDTYVGEEGSGWIEHWAITQGKIPQGAPAFPQWVIDRTKALHLSTGTGDG